jgi:Peptidase S46
MKRSTAILFCFLLSLPAAKAAEGMWPFNHLPLDQFQQRYGFKAPAGLFKRLQHASVRLNNGGSGSFVSPNGLLMTNHHVASDCIKKLSSEQKDYIADGFYAGKQADEMQCPDLEVNILMEIETVTDKINQKLTSEMSDKERFEAQRAATADVEKACTSSTGMRCDVVNLYQGGIFDLYKYKKYTDVRLVFAPEFKAAFFGGDPDNFTYPRYCLDVSFLRIYEDGKPAAPPAYLAWSKQGASDGELVFVTGHPGRTNRLLTVAQLEFDRDYRMPFMLDWLNGMNAALSAYSKSGGDAERRARDELFGIQNSIKAYTGMLEGLRDSELTRTKAAEEQKLRAAINADPAKKAEFGGAWDAIAKAQAVKVEIYKRYRLVDSLGFYTRLFTIAKQLYRLSAELPKPNNERLQEYFDSGLDSLYQRLFSPAPIYDDVEIAKFTESLRLFRDQLEPDDPMVKAALGGRTPEAAAKALIEGSKLKDVDLRKALAADQAKKAAASDDPMIRLVAALDDEARKLRKRYEDEVEAVERAQGAKIARGRFEAQGTNVYPDATFTLRLSDGLVKGYPENGRQIPPFTVIQGLFAKATGTDPYILAPTLATAKERLDMTTPYNLVSTNDITGGNSGSPLVNRKGEVVGLIFDGNIQSLSNDFLYSDSQARAVSVDVRGIVEALRNAYHAKRIVEELKLD